ncbi:hypothetical protein [Collimonas sp. OK607]|uniref:hypothetical protein n=1 Tax=Collimonas sp. OK607 TaxID=1798194 RepID=UPI0011140252|nr:hypothetical protein [Collimonas sp. OK607]
MFAIKCANTAAAFFFAVDVDVAVELAFEVAVELAFEVAVAVAFDVPSAWGRCQMWPRELWGNMFERSELVFPPDWHVTHLGT